ncbi:MAG TPA: CHAT domain-containing tetratricopeptide repeat protein, partial [Blastocatellia bacterium]|nr:CHAT domain-containing tetratricopeptide repeat protein [Blastocatellia bacterium]
MLNNIGDLYIFQGRYADALMSLQKAVKTNESLGSAIDKLGMGYHLHNIGQVYRLQGRYEQALEYNRRSLKIREEIDDKAGIGASQNNIGVIYKSQRLYTQALEWFQKALKSFEEATDLDGVAIALSNMGDIYRQQKRYDLALEYLQKSLRLHEVIGGRVGIAQALRDLSWVYRDKGDYNSMLEVSRRAAKIAEEVNAPEELWSAQDAVGKALRALGQTAQARQSFIDSIATIESLRHQVAGDGQQQQSFLENKLSPWLGMIDLLITQKEDAEALTFAERAKARVLLDLLQAGRTNIQKSLSPEERQQEEHQRLRLVSLNSQLTSELLSTKPDPTRIAELKSQLAKARLEFEALETRLCVAHPELKVNRGELRPITISEIAPLLNDQTALLEFAVSEDKTYLFVITKNKATPELKTYSLPLKRKDLSDRTEKFRKYLAEKDLRYSQPARELYDLLLKPVAAQLQGKTRLVIVPDGPLWELPFQALMNADNRFLIEEYAISTTPSLTFLREMTRLGERRNKTAQPTTLLAVGNPALGNEMLAQRAELMGDKLEPLPFAEQQAVQLGELYKANAKVLIGSAATEERIKAEAGRYRILHLATHGIVDDRNPMYS